MPLNIKKRSLWLIAGLLLGLLLVWEPGRYLQLEALQSSHQGWVDLYQHRPLAMAGAYFLAYVLVTALSLPWATVLTLAGGAIFGFAWGLLIVSFASALGATLAFLTARFLLRDTLEARFRQRLADINRGVAQDGAFYLLTLRLVPLVPFFVINLVMGLTTMRVRTFYLVSQLGMLAGTAVWVYAGTQLASLTSLQGVVSPGLLGALVLLGLFPLLARWLLAALRRRKVYARWATARPRTFDRNLIVIGAGAGGLVSAYIAATVNAKVSLIEAHKMGGDCLNYGCVPSKALISSARVAHQMRHAGRYGLRDAPATFSFKAVMQRVGEVIHAIEPHDSVARYAALGVEVLEGHARIVNPWTVEVSLPGDAGRAPTGQAQVQRLTTRSIVLATGARPAVPDLPGLAQVGYLTSDTLWQAFAELDDLPGRVLVLGGGPIGCELAQSFARLGAQITLVERGPCLMAREDAEVSRFVQDALMADGVRVLTGHHALRCEALPGHDAGQKSAAPGAPVSGPALGADGSVGSLGSYGPGVLVTMAGGVEVRVAFDALICAVGRSARLTGYGLEDLGIPVGRTIDTNEYLQTLYPNIYAAGDVAGPYQFTHAAAHQAWYATVNALFGDVKKFRADYSVVPYATFVDPEVARVGLNEQEARERGIAVEVTRFDLGELDRAIADAQAQGWVKVLTAPGSDRILGVTIVASHAAELLAEYVLAMKHGLGLNKILGTVHTYPTWSEANKYAAGRWRRERLPHRLLRWARRYHDWRRS